ncbi:MAG: Uma2 family endonuclease [Anaerolineae bacterium]|nr:Uma2 family endonuclease [Anaerolineae bacterium]
MVTRTASTELSERERLYGGRIVAENVSYEDYLSGQHGIHVEWINGVVIDMSPVGQTHNQLDAFLLILFRTFIEMTSGGRVHHDPFVMRAKPELPARQPDLQVILPDRMHFIQENQVAGPANLVVEIVSPESSRRDRGEKHEEYEQGGVNEYWILDPQRKEAMFYVRGADDLFHLTLPADGIYTSTVLPKLTLRVDLLWQDKLPTTTEIVRMVEAMVNA